MTNSPKKMKPWYRRKRVWGGVIVLLMIYFCLVPSPLRISTETTGLTEPLTDDGKIDYFRAFEQMYIDKLNPPENNGMRDMIAAFGPKILEQWALAETVPWEEMPTHEYGKNWFENRWIPLCEHMYIDPYQRPMFLDNYETFYGTMYKLKKKFQKEVKEGETFVDDDPDSTKLFEKLTTAPWKAEDYPEVAQWLEKANPMLDYFGMCVRKPNFVCWRQNEGDMASVLLPDVQAMRDYARNLRVRITAKLEHGNVDSVWYDIMSMYHVAQHYKQQGFFVVQLVGRAIEGIAGEAIEVMLQHAELTDEQLMAFSRELQQVYRRADLEIVLKSEKLMLLDGLNHLKGPGRNFLVRDSYMQEHFNDVLWLSALPFDSTIANKRLTDHFRKWERMCADYKELDNPAMRLKFAREFEKREGTKMDWTLALRCPLIRTRSQLLADIMFQKWMPSVFGTPIFATGDSDARYELTKIAFALERYKLANGVYPETLDALVPTYLSEVPLDPYTARKTLTYKLTLDAESPYLLYSYGLNGIDDGGKTEKGRLDGDVTFRR